MTKNISLTIEEDLVNYLDDLADTNGRSRSGMVTWLIKQAYAADKALDREARNMSEQERWQKGID